AASKRSRDAFRPRGPRAAWVRPWNAKVYQARSPLWRTRGLLDSTAVSPGVFDLVVAAALVLGFLLGRARGFAWQVSGIATLALGYLCAAASASLVARAFPETWPLDLRVFAAWSAVYALVTIGVYFVTLKLSKKIRELELE